MKKCLFVYNPESGKGKIKKNENYITERLSSKYEVSVFYTKYRNHLEEIITENGQDKDLIVVAGGDGTINEAVNGIKKLNKDIPLAIIPTGTTNDVAHSVGISRKIKKAVESIFGVKVQSVNTANVSGKEKSQDRGRTHGFTASYKKAYVKLTADSKSIEFFDSLS